MNVFMRVQVSTIATRSSALNARLCYPHFYTEHLGKKKLYPHGGPGIFDSFSRHGIILKIKSYQTFSTNKQEYLTSGW